MDVSTRFFWTASYGQIYPELARLEKLGLVTGEVDRANGRRPKFFSDSLSHDEQLELLRRIGRTHEEIAARLRAIEPESHDGKPPAPLLTLEFGIAYQEFLANWCAEAERRLGGAPANAGR